MDRAALDSLDRETLIRLIVSQAEVIERLTRRVAELETKLNLPKKTPDNSSTPPSKGQKPSAYAVGKDEGEGAKKRGKSHPGAHRPLHPNPTKNREIPTCACQHCGADVSQAPQFSCEAYDHIEIPPIKPEVTVRELPATNNGSEQAIRPAVIFRKVTYCFRSVWGAELYADIRSVIETGRRRAIDGFEAIRLTLAGKQLPAQAPS